MPTLKQYQNGMSASMGGSGQHERSPRGDTKGWTPATARRQRMWLWTVRADDLDGAGFAMTLTLLETPETAVDFHRLRRAWLKRLERLGAIRTHWVIEWQERGTPHLHAAVYFPPMPDERDTRHARSIIAWLEVCDAAGFTADLKSQDANPITGALGWLKYLAKHASRGANHYQRRASPEQWEKTGRMWGYTGSWPLTDPTSTEVSNGEFYRIRRLMRNWSRNEAARLGDWKRLAYLRRAGRPNDRYSSSFQGVSEWIPETVGLRLTDFFVRQASS